MHHSVGEACFRLLTGADSLRVYQFNKKIAKHFFCQTCGIHTYSHPLGHRESLAVPVKDWNSSVRGPVFAGILENRDRRFLALLPLMAISGSVKQT